MGTITSGIIVLCMFYQGGIIEHTYIQDQKMSSCLKQKEQLNEVLIQKMYVCNVESVDAIIEKDEDTGRYRVVKIVKDKYDSSGYTK
jgi:uncharacterized protein YneF (UPF0154 family)